MSMSSPEQSHARFEPLIGVWTGEETMHPSQWVPHETVAAATIENRRGAGGVVMVQDYEQRVGDRVTFSAHGVLWFDTQSGEACLHWWDGMGMKPNEFRGTWEDGRLELTSRSPMGHTRGTWVIGEGTYEHTMEMSRDGESWTVLMEGRYRRA